MGRRCGEAFDPLGGFQFKTIQEHADVEHTRSTLMEDEPKS